MKKKLHIFMMLAAFLTLQACVKTVEERGYATDFREIAKLDEEIISKQQVREKLGSPSSVSTFGDETWYYMRAKSERIAFMLPDAISREVLAISFDKEGQINNVEYYTLKDGRRIDFADDQTPTEGNELTIGEQLLGNLGRFNPNQ